MDCHQLSHGISVEHDCLHDCCLLRTSAYVGSPFIISLDENNLVDWEQVFKLKKSLKEPKAKDEKACNGCRSLEENLDLSNDEEFISFINFNHWNICNSRCIYCHPGAYGGDKYFNVYPLIKSLSEYKNGECLKNYGEITFQGGEPTILPEFEDLLNLFIEKKCKIRIHSSGIKYSLAIEKCLMQNLATVVISPDTAKKETYEKIKRVPCFDKVWDNIKKYSSVQIQSNLVKIKFIIIPGINDTVEEIDKFLEKCIESGIHNVIWEIEDRYTGMYNYDVPHACLLIDYAMNEAQKYGLEDEFYDGAIYSMKMRTNQKATITNKEDFEKMYNEEKAKYKDRECDYLQFLI